jgi:flagellar biosynthesis protein FlhA
MERTIESAVEHGEHNSQLNLAPQQIRSIVDRITHAIPAAESGIAIVTSSGARQFLKQMTESTLPGLAVIGHNEVPSGIRVLCLGTIK